MWCCCLSWHHPETNGRKIPSLSSQKIPYMLQYSRKCQCHPAPTSRRRRRHTVTLSWVSPRPQVHFVSWCAEQAFGCFPPQTQQYCMKNTAKGSYTITATMLKIRAGNCLANCKHPLSTICSFTFIIFIITNIHGMDFYLYLLSDCYYKFWLLWDDSRLLSRRYLFHLS
jgi:hypothetical protein